MGEAKNSFICLIKLTKSKLRFHDNNNKLKNPSQTKAFYPQN